MYGGYGNIWSQGSAQWPNANSTNQNSIQNQQTAATQAFQAQQQNLLGYGGNLQLANNANPSAAAGMMGYMNMGANPFMNYGGNGTGFNGLQSATTGTASWLGNQQFQLQTFPGGRPPLPPGPPPPDVPKENSQLNQFGNQNLPQQSSLAAANQQRAPPPPPPPPPPTQSASVANMVGNSTSATGSGNMMTLQLEDAYNIIKNVAAYGMLPSCGPIAPLSTLNVSEELFGAKNINKGIPGLDFLDDDKPATPAGPEVVDLDKDTDNLNNREESSSDGVNKPLVVENITNSSVKDELKKDDKSLESYLSSAQKKDLIWELRPDVKTQEWTRADLHSNESEAGIRTANNGWKTETVQQKVDLKSVSSGGKLPNNTVSASDIVKKEAQPFSEKLKAVESKTEAESRVQIPLESADGKELVYDRRTLKQFDHKFREWENQFEGWKRSNQNHPNQSSYKQYLDQWNFWREQLIEQRRSILDKMTKAKLDCKEILMAKFESFDAEDRDSSEHGSVDTSSVTSQSKQATKGVTDDSECLRENVNENPFEAALRENDRERRPNAPLISSLPDKKENSYIPELMPGLGDKKSHLHGSNEENVGRDRDRPVERILRNTGLNRTDRNIFDDDFKQSQSERNPFMVNSTATAFEEKPFPSASRESKSRENKPESGGRIPFEWTLSSQNKEDKNPFDMARMSDNPFMQPAGPNPFEIKNEQRLPSLDDFIKRTSLDFSTTSSGSQKQMDSENPFAMSSTFSVGGSQNTDMRRESQFERIPRDPQASAPKPTNTLTKPMRLEANPVGMPLLIAAKETSPVLHNRVDEMSRLFSRDRGHAVEDNNKNIDYEMDDDFVEDAEVIDYGAGGNSNDSMDFPRGENPDNNVEEDDLDFSLEDSEVIDYSQGVPPHDIGVGRSSGRESYGGYPEDFEHYPPHQQGSGIRGRGRGLPAHAQPGWDRGYSRGPPPGHPNPFERGAPGSHYPPGPDAAATRGRGSYRGMSRGIHGPPPQQEWFHHNNWEPQEQQHLETDPEIIELSPSPEPNAPPSIKIAPPNPEFERGERRRSRSRERFPRDRSRSRSRERVNRRGRDEAERRDDSIYGTRRERDRDRRTSPDRRGRNDDRDQRRDRDRFRDRGRRGRSKSKSPIGEDRNPVVRNPLFPSASAGMLGAHQASNPPPPRYQTVLIEDILNTPGRSKRPSRLVIFMRGLPGSGKSHIVKLIKEREVEMGGKAPRILSLDNYFITEMEKKEKDPVTGVEVKTTVMEYEYDEEREPLYRAQLVRQFKKTLDEGYFSFVIVDCVNEYLRQFEEMATTASQKRFQVYVAEIEESVEVCVKRNTHKRTKDEIMKIHRNWERTPSHFVKLDTRTLLQDEFEVEMEDVSDVETDNVEKAPTPAERGKIGPQVVDLEDIEDEDSGDHILVSSKWDSLEHSQEKLNKLDGLMRRKRANSEEAQVETAPSIETWLTGNMPDDYVRRKPAQPGQKRVRWADIEEKREQERMREVGFVVGLDWKRMMDPTGGSSALTRTKFF